MAAIHNSGAGGDERPSGENRRAGGTDAGAARSRRDHGHAGITDGRHSLIRGCLANGRPRATQWLAEHGAKLDLLGAAGTGCLDIVKTFFDSNGDLKSSATQRDLQRGFVWACRYGYEDVVEFLLSHRADLKDDAGSDEPRCTWR
jgi:hypothetical protein